MTYQETTESLLNEVISLIQTIENKLEKYKEEQNNKIKEIYTLLEDLQTKIDDSIKHNNQLHEKDSLFKKLKKLFMTRKD